MSRNDGNVTIEDGRIVFRNFSGAEGQYNRAGDRNFSVLLDEENAEAMARDGWNVKYLKVREEGDTPQAYIQVSVSWKNRPPRIVLITSGGRNPLGEMEVEVLDWIDIDIADMTLHPYAWAVGEKTGIKAYLKTLFITAAEDPIELKYAELERGSQAQAIESGLEDDIIDAEVLGEERPRAIGR